MHCFLCCMVSHVLAFLWLSPLCVGSQQMLSMIFSYLVFGLQTQQFITFSVKVSQKLFVYLLYHWHQRGGSGEYVLNNHPLLSSHLIMENLKFAFLILTCMRMTLIFLVSIMFYCFQCKSPWYQFVFFNCKSSCYQQSMFFSYGFFVFVYI